MLQIRYGLFETNSSSTHSLYFATDKEYEQFKKGEIIIDEDSGEFITLKDAVEAAIRYERESGRNYIEDDTDKFSFDDFRAMDKEEQIRILRDYEFISYDHMGTYYEYYASSYTTPSGDKIVAFGEFGRDG